MSQEVAPSWLEGSAAVAGRPMVEELEASKSSVLAGRVTSGKQRQLYFSIPVSPRRLQVAVLLLPDPTHCFVEYRSKGCTSIFFSDISSTMQRALSARTRATALSASKLRPVSLQQQRFAHKVAHCVHSNPQPVC